MLPKKPDEQFSNGRKSIIPTSARAIHLRRCLGKRPARQSMPQSPRRLLVSLPAWRSNKKLQMQEWRGRQWGSDSYSSVRIQLVRSAEVWKARKRARGGGLQLWSWERYEAGCRSGWRRGGRVLRRRFWPSARSCWRRPTFWLELSDDLRSVPQIWWPAFRSGEVTGSRTYHGYFSWYCT